MSYQQLINKINTHVRLTLEDKNAVKEVFQSCEISKNTIAQREFTIPKNLYFIQSGYMRLYYLNENGEEVTTRISKPTDFITPFLQFIHQRPSKYITASITDCQVLAVSGDNLRKLIGRSERFQEFSILIFEEAIEFIEKRADNLATLDAEQRYKLFIKNHTDILQNVPLKYIASYLGIKPESLSRIRKKLIT